MYITSAIYYKFRLKRLGDDNCLLIFFCNIVKKKKQWTEPLLDW